MRISDWSSDVCSSDLFRQREELSRRRIERADDRLADAVPGHVEEAAGAAGRLDLPRHLPAPRRIVAPQQRRHVDDREAGRSEEHTSELQSLMRISYAVFCLKKKQKDTRTPAQQRHHKP